MAESNSIDKIEVIEQNDSELFIELNDNSNVPHSTLNRTCMIESASEVIKSYFAS